MLKSCQIQENQLGYIHLIRQRADTKLFHYNVRRDPQFNSG